MQPENRRVGPSKTIQCSQMFERYAVVAIGLVVSTVVVCWHLFAEPSLYVGAFAVMLLALSAASVRGLWLVQRFKKRLTTDPPAVNDAPVPDPMALKAVLRIFFPARR